MERVPVVVVGAGQAGLAVSHELTRLGMEHVVLERGRVGQTWRDRWDSFCLVTPNWTVQLPGGAYDGPDPDGFMPRDEIVRFLDRYAAGFAAPVREGVDVDGVDRGGDGFVLRTSVGGLRADAVVVATGTYRTPHLPEAAGAFPDHVLRLTADDYRAPDTLPEGAVLVVGSGQSGCQIAEELHDAGREVVLACGRAPWSPRRVGDRDFVWWLSETGFLDASVDSLPGPEARLFANVLATGRGGGHDLHLRVLRDAGVTLAGRLTGVDGSSARFAPDLADCVAWGDERHRQLADLFHGLARQRGLDLELPEPEPFDATAPESVDLRGFGTVVFTTGFRPDYASWLPWPEAFDPLGFPLHDEGASTAVPELYFIGTHFLRKRKSSLLIGVGEDAAIVAQRIAAG
ncbi:MAG: NAD(P)-binding domain-containing protein [Gaiellaceae bacterium]